MTATVETFDITRNTVRFPLKLRMAVRNNSHEYEAETWNISAGGVLFDMDTELAIGSTIEFAIRMPAESLGTPGDVLVKCIGRVMRCTPTVKRFTLAALIDEYWFERPSAMERLV